MVAVGENEIFRREGGRADEGAEVSGLISRC